MQSRTLPRLASVLTAALVIGACQSEPIRLHQLRDAEAGSPERASYQRLEEAVALANDFLGSSPAARGFPAEQARFHLDHTDLLLDLGPDGIRQLRLATAGWGDPRTVIGDGTHPHVGGINSARSFADSASGDGARDDGFLALAPADMAATLLRHAVMMRDIETRGAFDYWLNYDLLGLEPGVGWDEENPVNAAAYAVERAFREWHSARG